MKEANIGILNENQNINKYDLNNNFENQSLNLIIQNKNEPILFLNTFPQNCQKINEKISLKEFINIMDNTISETIKTEIKDEDSSELIYFMKPKTMKNEIQTTFNTSKNLSFPESKDDFFNKKVNFKTILLHKRGRKSLEKKIINLKKYHGSSDFDNIQRKIQVNYITFLIRLANDAIKTVFGKKSKYFFKDIKYELKKIVSHKYVEHLKTCKYSDIIQMKISGKNKNFSENLNKNTLFEVCKISPILKNFFEKNYLYIFQKFYCRIKDNQNIIDFDGFKIKLSPLTTGYLNLLKKNESGKEKFNNVMNDVYFSGLVYNGIETTKTSNPFFTINSNFQK